MQPRFAVWIVYEPFGEIVQRGGRFAIFPYKLKDIACRVAAATGGYVQQGRAESVPDEGGCCILLDAFFHAAPPPLKERERQSPARVKRRSGRDMLLTEYEFTGKDRVEKDPKHVLDLFDGRERAPEPKCNREAHGAPNAGDPDKHEGPLPMEPSPKLDFQGWGPNEAALAHLAGAFAPQMNPNF